MAGRASGKTDGATERRRLGEPKRELERCRTCRGSAGPRRSSAMFGENPDQVWVRLSSRIADYRARVADYWG
ncbi:hypothetical protein ACWEKM_35550 [Streptomyces sp. NPDC004752]